MKAMVIAVLVAAFFLAPAVSFAQMGQPERTGPSIQGPSGQTGGMGMGQGQGMGQGMGMTGSMGQGGGMMMCPMMAMMGGEMSSDPKARGMMLQMHGEMMQKMGEIMQKYGKQLSEQK